MPVSFLAHPEGGNLDLSLHLHNQVDTMSFGSSAQKGCYCALSTAASHGQRKVSLRYFSKTEICIFMENHSRKALHKLVTHPTTLTSQNSGREVIFSKLESFATWICWSLRILKLENFEAWLFWSSIISWYFLFSGVEFGRNPGWGSTRSGNCWSQRWRLSKWSSLESSLVNINQSCLWPSLYFFFWFQIISWLLLGATGAAGPE